MVPSPPWNPPPMAPPPECETSPGMVIAGAAIAFVAGICVALAMVMQRYSLLYPAGDTIPFLHWRSVPRMRVWAWGMVFYQVSNGALAGSTVLAPLSLCTTCFTLMLVWNVILARWFLGEKPATPRVAGALLIVIGAVVSVFGVPTDVCNKWDVDGIIRLSLHWAGMTYFFVLLVLVVLTSILSLWFHRTYGIRNPPVVKLDPSKVASEADSPYKAPLPKPSKRLDSIMSFVCPISLALQVDLTLFTTSRGKLQHHAIPVHHTTPL